jgi:hypothetical protein
MYVIVVCLYEIKGLITLQNDQLTPQQRYVLADILGNNFYAQKNSM